MIKSAAALAFFLAGCNSYAQNMPAAAHDHTEFAFTVNLPYAEAFPLFGPWTEQQWAPDWKPQFLYPHSPADQPGAVFLVPHGDKPAVWVNTAFDPVTGHIGYVSLLHGALLTRIEIAVQRKSDTQTSVNVRYEWTAVDPAANDLVAARAQHFANAGKEWEEQINAYAAKKKSGH